MTPEEAAERGNEIIRELSSDAVLDRAYLGLGHYVLTYTDGSPDLPFVIVYFDGNRDPDLLQVPEGPLFEDLKLIIGEE